MREMNWREAATRFAGEFLTGTRSARFDENFPAELRAGKCAVACSGGADSLAALLLCWARFPELRERLVVLHYDHAVRDESAADAEFVRRVCESLGAEFVCERLGRSDIPVASAENLVCKKKINSLPHILRRTEKICSQTHHITAEATGMSLLPKSEGALRDLRMDFFARAMRERKIAVLVQGHQRDDIAESLLMRLTRGAGTDGLAAPRPRSRQHDGRLFVRPLLDFSKKEICAALLACEIPWREDATNAGTDYFRNRVRNRVLPELVAAAPFENFARSRKLLEEAADFIDAEAEKTLAGNFSPSAASVLAGKPAALVRVALQKIFAAQKTVPAAKNFDALVRAVAQKTQLVFSLKNRKVRWDGNVLEISGNAKTPPEKPAPQNWDFDAEEVFVSEELFGKICAGEFSASETVFLAGTPEIFVRNATPGERYRPLGASGEKRLSRIFIDKKIPQERRKMLPVFADGTGIAWIPGLPPAERFRICAPGITALRLTYRGCS